MQGVWVRGFEYSVFYENETQPVRVPTSGPPSNREIWLDVDRDLLARYALAVDDAQTRQYLIEFIGAKAEAPGYYGHFGVYQRGATAFKILSLQEIAVKDSSDQHSGIVPGQTP
jgi:hypothetical protein